MFGQAGGSVPPAGSNDFGAGFGGQGTSTPGAPQLAPATPSAAGGGAESPDQLGSYLNTRLGKVGGEDIPGFQQRGGIPAHDSPGIGTQLADTAGKAAVSYVASAAIPGLGSILGAAMNGSPFGSIPLSHEAREANEVSGLQNYIGNQRNDVVSYETPDALMGYLKQVGGSNNPYAITNTVGGTNLATGSWNDVVNSILQGNHVASRAQLGAPEGRFAPDEANYAHDIESQILNLIGATQLQGAAANPFKLALDRAAAPRNFYYQDTGGLPTWKDGQYTNQFLVDPNAKDFTGAYGNTFNLQRDFPWLYGAASEAANAKALENDPARLAQINAPAT